MPLQAQSLPALSTAAHAEPDPALGSAMAFPAPDSHGWAENCPDFMTPMRHNCFSIRHTEQAASNVPKRCPHSQQSKTPCHKPPTIRALLFVFPPPFLSPWVGVSCRLCTQQPRACTKQQQPPPCCPASGGNWSGITCPPRARRLLLQQTFQAGTPPDGKMQSRSAQPSPRPSAAPRRRQHPIGRHCKVQELRTESARASLPMDCASRILI